MFPPVHWVSGEISAGRPFFSTMILGTHDSGDSGDSGGNGGDGSGIGRSYRHFSFFRRSIVIRTLFPTVRDKR